MTDKPILTTFTGVTDFDVEQYKRYLPSAFDESLSILEKTNKVIGSQNAVLDAVNAIIAQVNAIQTWALGDGLNQDVIDELTKWLNDGTLANVINQTVFDNMQKNIDDIYIDAKNKGLKCDGTDETSTLQDIVNTYKYILIPADVSFKEVTLTMEEQKIMVQGKVHIVNGGKGFIFGSTSQTAVNIEVICQDVIGDTLLLQNGAFNPSGQNSGFYFQNSNFCRVNFQRLEGFRNGLDWSPTGNGTENKFHGGVIQLCDKAINIANTSGGTAHEGNTFSQVSIFNCNTGAYIDANSKYQYIQGVIDCSGVNNSMDIVDHSSANIYHLYYVRGSKVTMDNESLLYIFSNVTGNEINFGGLSIAPTGLSRYKDDFMMTFGDASTQNAYRFATASDGYEFKHIADGSQNNVAFKIMHGGYTVFPKKLQGAYNGFVGFDMTTIITNPQDGMKITVIDTDTVKIREYNYLYSKWVWHDLDLKPKYASNDVVVNTASTADVIHSFNCEIHELVIDLKVNDAGNYRTNTNVYYSVVDNNTIRIHNDDTVNLQIKYVINKVS